MNRLESLITSCVAIGTARTLETLGITSGEISANKAKATYGKYFTEVAGNGRLQPSRVGGGKHITKWYRVADILALKAADAARAELKHI